MKRSMVLMLSLALGGALAALPVAQADGGPRCSGNSDKMAHHGRHSANSHADYLLRHLLKNKQELGLTDEQISKLRAVALDAYRAKIRASANQMISERELRAMVWDDKTELSAIESKVKDTELLEAEVRIIGIRAKRELSGVLTPDQKTKLKALWEQAGQHDRGRRMRTASEATGDATITVPFESERTLSAG